MKVLLVGATGNLGLRLVASLLTHKHTVTAYVRSSAKLESLLPESVYRQISVVQGDATNRASIKRAILDSNSDAVVNTAGLAAMAPWRKGDLPAIFRAVVDGARDAGVERGGGARLLRVWMLAGFGVLKYPGTESLLSDYIPVFLEHRGNLSLLQSLPANTLDWSLLCPAVMNPESPNVTVPSNPAGGNLLANATSPPLWRDSWVRYIPLIGRTLLCAMNAGRYTTTLEQNADFIANDLESYESRWSGVAVGVVGQGK